MDVREASGPGSEPRPGEQVRGMGEQIGRFRDAGRRLVRAHVELARAEISDIAAEIKSLVALGGLALGLVVFALTLIAVGLPLFLGDWLFGSMGWGIFQGVLLAVAGAVTALAAALGARGRTLWLPILGGVAVAIAIALLLGSDAAFNAASELVARGEPALRIDLPSGWDTLAAGAVGGAVVGALLLVVIGVVLRRSLRGALGLLFDGLILGAVLGAVLGATRYGLRVGTAIGVTLGLLIWIAAAGAGISGLDVAARFARLTPSTTIETARETWEWVRARIRPATR